MRNRILTRLILVISMAATSLFSAGEPDRFRINLNGKYGYIDSRGKIVIEPIYESARNFHGNLAAVRLNGFWRFIDQKGKWIDGEDYVSAQDFHEGLAWVLRQGNDKHVLLNERCEKIFEALFIPIEPFVEGKSLVNVEGRFHFFSTNSVFPSAQSFYNARSFSEGLAACSLFEGHRYGYVNRTLNWVIPPQFDQAEDFSCGLAAVRIGDRFGYIDKEGRVVVDFRYKTAGSFHNGLAWVSEGSKRHLINTSGEPVYLLIDGTTFFTEGVMPVYVDYGVGRRWGYVNEDLEFVISPRYQSAIQFTNGLAVVKEGRWFKYIDKTGKIVWNMLDQP